ncbi:MAG: hypothetical protein ACXWPS_09470 [Ktedonobacteraceae bacterium]
MSSSRSDFSSGADDDQAQEADVRKFLQAVRVSPDELIQEDNLLYQPYSPSPSCIYD